MDQLSLVYEKPLGLSGPSFLYPLNYKTVVIRQQNKLLLFDLVKRQQVKELIILSPSQKSEQLYIGNPCGVHNDVFYEILNEHIICVDLLKMEQNFDFEQNYPFPTPLSGNFMQIGNSLLIQNAGVIIVLYLQTMTSFILCQVSDQDTIPSTDYVFYIRNEQQLCTINGKAIKVNDTVNNVILPGGQISTNPYLVRALEGNKLILQFVEQNENHQILCSTTETPSDEVVYQLKNSCKSCVPYLADDLLLIVDQKGNLLILRNEKLKQAAAIVSRVVFTSKQKLSLAGQITSVPEPDPEPEVEPEPQKSEKKSPITSPVQSEEIKRLEEEENELDKEVIQLQKELEDVDRKEKEEEQKEAQLETTALTEDQKEKEKARIDKLHKDTEARREQIQIRLRHVEMRKKEIRKRVCGPTFQDKIRFFSGQ